MLLRKTVKLFLSFFYKILLRKKKVYISLSAKISLDSRFEGKSKIYSKSRFISSRIGYASYIATEGEIVNTQIGKYCSIGPRVKTIIGRHPLSPFVSTSPSFYSILKQNGFSFVLENYFNEFKFIDEKRKLSILIKNDVWIGADVKILEGVTIGNGAIVAAGSIVVKDVPDFEIWGGVPAKKIRDRFSQNQKKILLDSSWWSKNPKWIEKNKSLFLDIDRYCDFFKNKSIEG